MKIMFSGHRDKKASSATLEMIRDLYEGATWIHGGAKGFDEQVSRFAVENNILQEVFLPDYGKYKRGAPLKRNDEMLKESVLLVALYDGRKNGGTFYTVKKAQQKGMKIIYATSL